MKRVLTVLISGSVAFTGLVGGASADAGVSWRECPDRPGAECGVVEVPRDWSPPSGPKVELSVVRRRATEPGARVGTLFYNPGGPGAPAALDIDPQIRGYRDVRTRMKDVRSVAPHMRGMSEFWDMTVGCAGWPLSPSNPQRAGGISGVPPVLVVGNTHDPATPLRWARSLSARIEGAGLLVDDGDGHTSYRRSACATKHIDGYLVTGRLPTAGTVCGPERT